MQILTTSFSFAIVLWLEIPISLQKAKVTIQRLNIFPRDSMIMFVCLCWGFTAQSTQWGHVERGQFT